ncbi:unnamed protein product [Protopolystoma xenopodis]|uniref:Uncharacterized protein n=1 Tax=Protopolystoma xenopodis TaxID=117903 RepID=A0A448WR66_9PLAT|nr:unnamed protein product [Protopolystoma xenopodis]
MQHACLLLIVDEKVEQVDEEPYRSDARTRAALVRHALPCWGSGVCVGTRDKAEKNTATAQKLCIASVWTFIITILLESLPSQALWAGLFAQAMRGVSSAMPVCKREPSFSLTRHHQPTGNFSILFFSYRSPSGSAVQAVISSSTHQSSIWPSFS